MPPPAAADAPPACSCARLNPHPALPSPAAASVRRRWRRTPGSAAARATTSRCWPCSGPTATSASERAGWLVQLLDRVPVPPASCVECMSASVLSCWGSLVQTLQSKIRHLPALSHHLPQEGARAGLLVPCPLHQPAGDAQSGGHPLSGQRMPWWPVLTAACLLLGWHKHAQHYVCSANGQGMHVNVVVYHPRVPCHPLPRFPSTALLPLFLTPCS